MGHEDGEGRGQLQNEIPVRHRVQAVQAHAGKAQLPGGHLPVDGMAGARQGAGPQGILAVHPGGGVLQPPQVPQQHPGIGQELMPEGDGLSPLQMGISGHDGAAVGFRLVHEGGDHGANLSPGVRDPAAEIQTSIHRHLVVPAAGGMEHPPRVALPLGELRFHKAVDILRLRIDGQRAGIQLLQDLLQTGQDLLHRLRRNDPLGAQHGGMGHAAPDILPVHAAVHPDGGVEVVRRRIGGAAGPALPKPCHQAFFPSTTAWIRVGRP